jgi:hypothetical protein
MSSVRSFRPPCCSVAPRAPRVPRGPVAPALFFLVAAVAAAGACDGSEAAAPALPDVGALRAKVSACGGVDAAAAFTFFWPRHLSGVADAVDCVAAARDCSEVLACAGYSGAGCSATDDRCEGGSAFACVTLAGGLNVAQQSDCAGDPLGNTSCSVAEDAKYGVGAFCHGPGCVADHCDGDAVVRCRGGFEVRTACGVEGQTCAEHGGQVFCAFTETCAADRCTGDVIELCNGGRITLRERCGELVPGTTCTDRMGLVECMADVPSTGCSMQTDFASWCDSGLAVTCFGGVRAEVDCASLPEGACQARIDDGSSSAMCIASEPF